MFVITRVINSLTDQTCLKTDLDAANEVYASFLKDGENWFQDEMYVYSQGVKGKQLDPQVTRRKDHVIFFDGVDTVCITIKEVKVAILV